ncbi:conserved unknown protein [Ectocarpus siliculosus]|uniref:Bestrophin homolog n=1 Tax=Ectocarpus siliculosus TaxID=2880 RepID=D8LEB5_ECTSI|nr:conserved unknown protein [Ectocarpus siliculosus]|eukprot:CBN74200.1 conserved unknown protein [Ectocarpus siliculosus]
MSGGQGSFRVESASHARQLHDFFAVFWRSTPHPFAQMTMLLLSSALVATLNDERVLDAGLHLSSNTGRSLQTILSFLIVFRTNQSYNRWWEGRILWGKMHWSCVELTQQAAVWIDDTQLARRIMNISVTFAYVVKQILRREQLFADEMEGVIDAAEVELINNLPPLVMPYYCTEVMRQCIKKGLADSPQAFGTQAVARGIDVPVSQLSVQFADMERVRNTPQPDCFRVMLHMFTLLYLLVLPVISYDTLGYFVVLEMLVTAYLMLGLQIAADHLEDPFGRDESDLQLDRFVAEIAAQCRAAFYLGSKNGADLTLDGGGATNSKPRRPPGDGSEPDPGAAVEKMGDGAVAGGGGGGGGSDGGAKFISTTLGWDTTPVLSSEKDSTSALGVSPTVSRGGASFEKKGEVSFDRGGSLTPRMPRPPTTAASGHQISVTGAASTSLPQPSGPTPTSASVSQDEALGHAVDAAASRGGGQSPPSRQSQTPVAGMVPERQSSFYQSVGKNAAQFAIVSESCHEPEDDGPIETVERPWHNSTRAASTCRDTSTPVGQVADSNRDPSPGSSGRWPSPQSEGGGDVGVSVSSAVAGLMARNLSIKNQQLKEGPLPVRRGKPRPGRGKPPMVDMEEGAASGDKMAPSEAVSEFPEPRWF